MNTTKVKTFVSMVLCMLLLAACGKDGNETAEAQRDGATGTRAYMATSGMVCDKVLYLMNNKSDNIRQYVLETQEENIEPSCVCSDVLCTHDNEECPLYMHYYIFTVDDYETRQNNNAPIIYSTDYNTINKYDGAKNHTELIKEYDDGFLSSMWICDDRIYMTYFCMEDKVTQLRCIDKDGRNERILSRENGDIICRIVGFDEKYLYYYDAANGYYRVDRDLNQEELLFRTDIEYSYPEAVICDGYMYYGDKFHIITEGKANFGICSMFRLELANITTAAPELIEENILVSGTPNIFLSGDKVYYYKCNPKKVGESKYVDPEGQTYILDACTMGSNVIYCFDPKTGVNEALFEDLGVDATRFYYADNQYVLVGYTYYELDEEGYYIAKGGTVLYDYVNDKKQYLIE